VTFSSKTSNNSPNTNLYKTGITVLAVLVFQAGIFDRYGSSNNRVAVRTIQAFQFLTKRSRTKITDRQIQSVHDNFSHATAHPDWIATTAFN
jgi:hypothetical protein